VYAHRFWYDGYHTTGCCLIIDWHPDLPTDRDASHIVKAYVHRTRTTFVNSTIKSLLPLKKNPAQVTPLSVIATAAELLLHAYRPM